MIAGWVCGLGVFVLCMYVSQCMCISLYFCLGTYLSVCVSEWWSMYASHSCPSLSVFLPLWGLHVIFSISGLQARKHIHLLHLHALQPPLRLVVGLDGVQVGTDWVLSAGFGWVSQVLVVPFLGLYVYMDSWLACDTICSISHHI